MERQTIKKPLNGRGNNIPKDTFPLHYMGRPFEQKTTLKDASFSSYLRPEPPPPPPPKPEDNSRFAVDDSDQISVFEAENYFSEKDQNGSNKRDSLTENHHNDKAAQQRGCEFSAISRLSSVSSTDGYGYGGKLRARSFHATPTASSEASWNSQTGLLSNPQGSIPISLRNTPSDNNNNGRRNGGYSGNGTKWFLGLKCPCYGKNSVQVEENLSQPKTEPKTSFPSSSSSSSYPKRQCPKSINHHPTEAENRSIQSQNNSVAKKAEESIIPEQVVLDYRPFTSENRFPSHEGHQHHRRRRHHHNHHHHQGGLGSFRDGVGFSFPILNQSMSSKVQVPTRSPLDEPPRESLEIFQPPEESMDVQQRRGFGYPTSPTSRMTGTEEDGGSDASSDLFEIESFSTQTTSYRRRDSLDDEATTASYGRRQSVDEPVTPSVAATECYEPSEASINWSVTTAEGFDRGSVTNFSISASEFGDVANMRRQEAEVSGGGGGWGKRRSGGGGNGGGLLLSCRWEKAVSVGPTQQQGKWGQEDGSGGGGGRRVVGGGGGGPPMPMISTMRHVSSRPYKR